MRKLYIRSIIFATALLISFTGCSPHLPVSDSYLGEKNKPQLFAIKNVTIVPMTEGGSVMANATVIIKNGVIVSLNGPIPVAAKVIDGTGKWLMPGLIDMHVHTPVNSSFGAKKPTHGATLFFNTQDIMTPFIANGVTTIFDLSAKAEHFAERNEIIRGNIIGPRMALAALIDGGTGSGRIANTPSDGRQAVRMVKAEGYEFVKVYSGLNVETFTAIVEEAARQGLKVIGHIPDAFKGRLKDAFIPNYDMVAHAEEFSKQSDSFSDEDAQRFAQFAKQNGTWLSPTLTTIVQIASQARSLDELRASPTLKYVHPLFQSKWLYSNNYYKGPDTGWVVHLKKMIDFHRRLIKAFRQAGVPIVTGTDTGVSGVVAGFSLHDEIELLVDAGLTNLEALTSATRLPATWLGIGSEVGTVEAGKFADLILLDADPLADVKNTRLIAGVFVNGRWVSNTILQAMLADLAKRNTASKADYDWKKMTGR